LATTETTDRYYATGKRKNAVARVWLLRGTGRIMVNGRPLGAYLERPQIEAWVLAPLAAAGRMGEFDVRARIHGGGKHGQAGALRHGIARALCEMDAGLRPVLGPLHMLTRDPRVKERKHAGFRSARRKKQFSKR
jgi:small subunit ribosomal protein S9